MAFYYCLLPLPFAPLSRTISLTARRGVLGDMPQEIAGRLRRLVQGSIVAPALARYPWMEGSLRTEPALDVIAPVAAGR